jgi:hypothetical protein
MKSCGSRHIRWCSTQGPVAAAERTLRRHIHSCARHMPLATTKATNQAQARRVKIDSAIKSSAPGTPGATTPPHPTQSWTANPVMHAEYAPRLAPRPTSALLPLHRSSLIPRPCPAAPPRLALPPSPVPSRPSYVLRCRCRTPPPGHLPWLRFQPLAILGGYFLCPHTLAHTFLPSPFLPLFSLHYFLHCVFVHCVATPFACK